MATGGVGSPGSVVAQFFHHVGESVTLVKALGLSILGLLIAVIVETV
jgi:hypothetical protein